MTDTDRRIAEDARAPLRGAALLLDRTAVLAVGIVAGALIGLSFGGAPTAGLPEAAPSPAASASLAPPPEADATLRTDVVARVQRDGKVRVGVFGDSFGDGVWAALYHQLPEKKGYEVLRFSKEATGFTRYRQLDLEERARVQLERQPVDVAVICFGANDLQPVFAEGHLRALLDEGWKKLIGERIDRFVAEARSTGAQVYWVGLPVMRDAAMDANVRAMNAFYAARMKALDVPFLETRGASLDARGGYAPYLPDSDTGEMRLVRAGDGIHMTMGGYQRLTVPLAARIRRHAARLRAAAGIAQPPEDAPPVRRPASAPASTPAAAPAPRRLTDEQAVARANRRERRRQERVLGLPAPAASPAAQPSPAPPPASTPAAVPAPASTPAPPPPAPSAAPTTPASEAPR